MLATLKSLKNQKQWHWVSFLQIWRQSSGKREMQHQTLAGWSCGWFLTWGWEERAGTVKLPFSSVRLQDSALPWQSAATPGQCLSQLFSLLLISAAWCWERDKWALTLLPAQPCCPCAERESSQTSSSSFPVLYITVISTESPLDMHNSH